MAEERRAERGGEMATAGIAVAVCLWRKGDAVAVRG